MLYAIKSAARKKKGILFGSGTERQKPNMLYKVHLLTEYLLLLNTGGNNWI